MFKFERDVHILAAIITVEKYDQDVALAFKLIVILIMFVKFKITEFWIFPCQRHYIVSHPYRLPLARYAARKAECLHSKCLVVVVTLSYSFFYFSCPQFMSTRQCFSCCSSVALVIHDVNLGVISPVFSFLQPRQVSIFVFFMFCRIKKSGIFIWSGFW